MSLLLLFGGAADNTIRSTLNLSTSISGEGQPPATGDIASNLELRSAVSGGVQVNGDIASDLTFRSSLVGTSGATYGDIDDSDPAFDPDANPGDPVAARGWQVRAVTDTGTLVSLLKVTVNEVRWGMNAQEEATLTVGTLSPATDFIDLFSHEIQLHLDGELYFWGRPARIEARNQSPNTDEMTVVIGGLFGYFNDVRVGGTRTNHITSPHEDSAAVDAAPAAWSTTSNIEDAAVVDNNAEFWQQPKAIQLNNSETGENAYMSQQHAVDASLVDVPFAAAAYVYVADDQGGAPAWGGPALDNRGLLLLRLDGSGDAVSEPQIAYISDETPRNEVIRLQTGEVLPQSGETLEVRCYAPDAYTVWRFVALYDGRAVEAVDIDKTEAVRVLVEHAQDTSLGKQNHRIGTNLVSVGEKVSRTWPWWRRDRVGEQILSLADTVELKMVVTDTTRTLRVREKVGVKRAAVTKTDLHRWSLGSDITTTATAVWRQGAGSGIGRDEWYDAIDTTDVREDLSFGQPGEGLQALRDAAEERLDRVARRVKVARATISGSLATQVRAGDTIPFELDHGWAHTVGDHRATQVVFDGAGRTAELMLEPV